MHRRLLVLLAVPVAMAIFPAGVAAVQPDLELTAIGRYETGLIEELGEDTAAETVAWSRNRMFVSNATDASIDIVDLTDPANPSLLLRVDLSAYGDSVSSVEAHGNAVAVAVVADPKTAPGKVVFLNRNGVIRDVATVGALPDSVAFTPNGKKLVVANEGEPNDDYTIDPFGSVSILSVKPFMQGSGETWNVRTLNFSDFSAGGPRADELPDDVRIFGSGASVAQDLEPEFAAISKDSRWAWVSLQENNAMAIVDLQRRRIKEIVALGFKDHSLEDNGLDASDDDGAINITEWPVHGMYQPDAMSAFKLGGATYVVTANEGDARDYDPGLQEEERVKDLDLDDTAFPDEDNLNDDENLGRLNVTTTLGDTDDDGDYDELYSFGTRSFSIWSASGQLLWDSGDELEQLTATALPDDFNSDNAENDSFDNRSDNKGPEPEALTTGKIDGRWYAFIGLERTGGVAVFDVTDPLAPEFVQYVNTRDFGAADVGPDSGPEDIKFVNSLNSPTGNALLLVSNEITGTVTVYEAGTAP